MENVEVIEHKLKAYLLKNIHNKNALERIAELIDKSLSKCPKFLELHYKNQFKNYCFNSFYKLETSGIYQEGQVYSIIIRTVDKELSEHFKNNLVNEYTEHIKVLTIEEKRIKKRHIEKIYSITPVVVKTEEGYWKNHLSLKDFENLIVTNLIKKYNFYYNTKLDENFQFFNMMEFNNHKPIATPYKNINIIGDKITFYIAENDTAQKLAHFSLGSSLGTMGARGFGFVNYKWI